MHQEDLSDALTFAASTRGLLDPARSRFKLFQTGTYDDLYVAEGVELPLVARVRVRCDESAGNGIASQHDLLGRVPPGVGPRPVHVDCSCSLLRHPFRIEEFLRGDRPSGFDDQLIAAVAAMLAALHGRVGAREALSPASDAAQLNPYEGMLQLLEPDPAREPRVEALSALARRAARDGRVDRPDLSSLSLLHGDVHLGNMVRDGARCMLIDWEHIHVGDPAIDVATLFWFSAMACGQERPFSAAQRELFFRVYLPLTGDETLPERVGLHELIVVALQLASWSQKLVRGVDSSAVTQSHIDEIPWLIERSLAMLERDAPSWLAAASSARSRP